VYTGADGLRVGTVLAVRPHGDRAYVGGEQGLMFLSGERFLPIVGVGADRFRGTSGIVETPTGDLWLHGADGITRIALEEVRRAARDTTYRVRFTRLDFRDGLDGAAPQIRPLPSVVEASDGRLWFVTGTGVSWLDPEHILNNPVPPPVHIRSLTVGDTEYEPSRGVRLATRTTALRIRYTALSLAIPERVRFRYQLVGSDTGWQDVGTRREAFYTNLRPGSYRFRVTASNDDGVWNESGAAMDFVIPPTFLQTNAFLALCGLAVGGVAWMLYRLRVRQVAGAMRATFDATLAERTRIAQELHDTLLQGFTGITLHLQGLQRMITDRPGDAAESLARVLELAAATLRDARRTVWGMRMADLESRDLPDALTTAARDTLAGTSIDFRFAVRGEPRQLANDVEVTALRIGREAVINALKHANPQIVEMVLEYEPRSLTLHVRDDGRGLAAADASIAPHTGHWGIVGMRERATRVGGSLEISGAPDLGTVVSVSLPIGADH
jgi:signal transduction histidine kinase